MSHCAGSSVGTIVLVWGCCQFSARSREGRKHRQTVEFALREVSAAPGRRARVGVRGCQWRAVRSSFQGSAVTARLPSAGCRCPADPDFPSHVSASSSPAGTEGWAARLPVSGDLQLLAALQVRCLGWGAWWLAPRASGLPSLWGWSLSHWLLRACPRGLGVGGEPCCGQGRGPALSFVPTSSCPLPALPPCRPGLRTQCVCPVLLASYRFSFVSYSLYVCLIR